jgi:hypothetical protein
VLTVANRSVLCVSIEAADRSIMQPLTRGNVQVDHG